MANVWLDSVLLEARSKILEKNEKIFEQRAVNDKVIDLFLTSTASGYSNEDLAAIRKSDQQSTSILYKKKKIFAVGTSKTCSPTGETGGSGKITPTWITRKAEGIASATQALNNGYSLVEQFSSDLFQQEITLLFDSEDGSISRYLRAYLEGNRTQVNKISTSGISQNTWNGGALNFASTPVANINRFYNYAMADMRLNNYSTIGLLELCNTSWIADYMHIKNQTATNATNFSYQFDGFNVFDSNGLVPSTGYGSNHYIIPSGGVALFNWTKNDKIINSSDPILRQNLNSGQYLYSTYESMFYPGLFYDLFIKYACSDTTADGGSPQDPTMIWELAMTIAPAVQPMSEAGESPIFKYQIATT